MLTRAEKYANAEKAYDAHMAPTKVQVDQKLESSRQVPVESGNQRNHGDPIFLHLTTNPDLCLGDLTSQSHGAIPTNASECTSRIDTDGGQGAATASKEDLSLAWISQYG